ncbi:nicotinate phosphoribosyltransferase, partial [Streptomyces cellulosae]
GRRTGPRATLAACRDRLSADLAALPPQARRIRQPVAPRATVSGQLGDLTARVRRELEERTTAAAGLV